ncbi:DUF2264 domain-containing protein [Streptosporangium vulgare]|uniref:DUF2264 domain-containing protein n=1 Tax=Streptosporangium vulgare TaxID=46190 RepID=UPI003380E654
MWDTHGARGTDNLAAWLLHAMTRETADNNWRFLFPCWWGSALRPGRGALRPGPNHARLERLESFALGGGWYGDGPTAQRDYYVPFAMHFYGLVYAALPATATPAGRSACAGGRRRSRSTFQHWFTSDGAAVPFGRSLTYRFAQGAFWGALGFAGVEALPWGEVRGHLMRHLRWWLRRPLRDASGLLTLGYGYAQPALAEQYNAPGSPYWAMKAFLPLALTATATPSGRAGEEPARELPETSVQRRGRCRADAVRGGQAGRHAERRGSTTRGCGTARRSTPSSPTRRPSGSACPPVRVGLEQGALDSTLALSDDGTHWRPCE